MKVKSIYFYLILELLLLVLLSKLVVDTGSAMAVLYMYVPIVIFIGSLMIAKKEKQLILYVIQTLMIFIPTYLTTGTFILEHIGLHLLANLFGYFLGYVFRKPAVHL